VSRCLLGDEVRFDGGHKRDHFLTDVLSRHVEWVPICPEVEAGLGTPREAMQLVGDPRQPRLVTIKSGNDRTEAVETVTERRMKDLKELDVSGYVFKKNSPSCGIDHVRVYTRRGMVTHRGIGIFARSFLESYPLVPVEEEGRLCDPVLRENFIERVFCYRRYQDLLANGVTRQALVRFHTIHKYLLLSHGQQHYEALGCLIGHAPRYRPMDLATTYGARFMKALAVKATVRKHVNVLLHILAYFKKQLATHEKAEMMGVIEDYHRGLTPLIVPLTLIRHYVRMFDVAYIRDQVYLNPHPKELMLRNHV
jgi:uncharacterized protein YbgA (DUF1722 family)/uncharacterized protein YbbK (DUF523 family)